MNTIRKITSFFVILIIGFSQTSCSTDDYEAIGTPDYGGKNVIKTVWFQSSDEPQTITLPPTLSHALPKCSDTWFSVNVSDANMTISVEDYKEAKKDDRTATISFSGSKDKIMIVQSKYKEKDTYVVNNVYAGVVVCMKDSIRLVSSTYLGELPWSIYQNKHYGTDNYDDGMVNTLKMKQIPFYLQEFPALAAIDALNAICFGSTDVTRWYMPAIHELTLAWSRTGISNWGWSSTEKNTLDAQYSDYSRYWGWDKSKKMGVYGFYRF